MVIAEEWFGTESTIATLIPICAASLQTINIKKCMWPLMKGD